jgi:hypothetical protein
VSGGKRRRGKTAPDAPAPAPAPAARPRPAAPRPVPPEFEQLTLDATITGPGMRTEDPYEPGTRLKVEGERGVFVYKCASVSQAGLVSLHLIQDGIFRAVRPEQVTPVKKVRRTRSTRSGPSSKPVTAEGALDGLESALEKPGD